LPNAQYSHGVPPQRFDNDRIVHDIDSSIAAELNLQNRGYKFALVRGITKQWRRS
jgi:hypothetical protein